MAWSAHFTNEKTQIVRCPAVSRPPAPKCSHYMIQKHQKQKICLSDRCLADTTAGSAHTVAMLAMHDLISKPFFILGSRPLDILTKKNLSSASWLLWFTDDVWESGRRYGLFDKKNNRYAFQFGEGRLWTLWSSSMDLYWSLWATNYKTPALDYEKFRGKRVSKFISESLQNLFCSVLSILPSSLPLVQGRESLFPVPSPLYLSHWNGMCLCVSHAQHTAPHVSRLSTHLWIDR